MKRGFYWRLAFSNLKRGKQAQIPYLISCAVMIALLYIVHFLAAVSDPALVSGGRYTMEMMKQGGRLFSLLAALFLFYTNSFIIKRRKKEFGLYHILGLEKRQVCRVLQYESLISKTTVIAAGILLGTLLYPLMNILLEVILGQQAAFAGLFQWKAALTTALLFAAVFIVLNFFDMRQIKKADPIELLHAASQGEREPKANKFLACLGGLLLITGYVLSLTVRNPKSEDDIMQMIVAALLIVAATYLVFISVSIAVLKTLKKRESIYYRPRAFTLISGMMYRMKQSGAGLANICVLCTATLLVMTTTASLYFGVENVIQNSFVHDVYISMDNMADTAAETVIWETQNEYDVEINNLFSYSGAKYKADLNGDGTEEFYFLMTLSDYNRLTDSSVSLAHNEALVYAPSGSVGSAISSGGEKLEVRQVLTDFPVKNNFGHIYGNHWWYIVLSDDSSAADALNMTQYANAFIEFDLEGDGGEQREFVDALVSRAEQQGWIGLEAKVVERERSMMRFGSLLFLGMLISIVLFTQTALSVFYKQVSEGYDDKQRFAVLGKVGMSKKEIRRTVRTQTLIVFFLPLIGAVLHLCVALPMVGKLLKIAFLDDPLVIAGSGFLCIVVFCAVYALMFLLTEKTYINILGEKIR